MKGEAAALLAALSWAIASVLYKKGLYKIEPFPANIVRLVIGTFFVTFSYILVKGLDFQASLEPLLYVVAGGLVGLGLGDLLFLKSLKYAGVSRAVPISSTYPLFTILFSTVLLKEKAYVSTVLGTCLIVAGIWLLHEKTDSENQQSGILFAIGTAITWAFSIYLTSFGLRSVEPFLATTIRLPLVLLFLSIIFYSTGGRITPEKISFAYLGIASVLALGVGSFLFLYSITLIQTARATSLSSVIPLFSTVFAIIFLKERVTLRMTIGILSIVIGIWLL
jgi:DME family drug/metabolite transporter